MQYALYNAVLDTGFLDALHLNASTPVIFGGLVATAIIGALFVALRNTSKLGSDSLSSSMIQWHFRGVFLTQETVTSTLTILPSRKTLLRLKRRTYPNSSVDLG